MLNYNCFKCGYVAIVVKMNFVVMKINLPQTRNFVGDRICFCECGPTQKFVQSGSEANILGSNNRNYAKFIVLETEFLYMV